MYRQCIPENSASALHTFAESTSQKINIVCHSSDRRSEQTYQFESVLTTHDYANIGDLCRMLDVKTDPLVALEAMSRMLPPPKQTASHCDPLAELEALLNNYSSLPPPAATQSPLTNIVNLLSQLEQTYPVKI